MNKLFYIACIITLLLLGGNDAFGQVRKKKTNKKQTEKENTETVSLMDKLNPEILLGNLGFFNGFYASLKADIGYKLSNRFTAGAGGKLFYNQFSVPGPDPSLFDFGGMVFARGKITNEIYIQAEYDFVKYADRTINFNSNLIGKTINYPMMGLGYTSGAGKWRFGIQLLYIFSTEAQDYQGRPIEYWAGASYNF